MRARSKTMVRPIIPRALAALVLTALFGAPLGAQDAVQPRPKLRIAVRALSDDAMQAGSSLGYGSRSTTVEIPPPEDFARGLTEMLTTVLVESNRFVVLERAQLDEVMDEQDLAVSGRVNPETAAEQGRVIGAQILITGAITEYAYSRSSLGGNVSVLRRLDAKGERVSATVGIDLRVLDAETGEVLFSQKGEGSATSTGVGAQVELEEHSFGSEVAASTPLGRASRDAVTEVVEELLGDLADVPWTGRIIDVRGERVYINAGSSDGIAVGMEFEVYAQEEALIDPATGRTLGAPEERIGALRVTVVEEAYAVAEITEGEGFERNHLLRFAGTQHLR